MPPVGGRVEKLDVEKQVLGGESLLVEPASEALHAAEVRVARREGCRLLSSTFEGDSLSKLGDGRQN